MLSYSEITARGGCQPSVALCAGVLLGLVTGLCALVSPSRTGSMSLGL